MKPIGTSSRGQALIELGLVLPVLIVMIVLSGHLSELANVKLRLQEATRFVAWEMSSYPLDDFGSANHSQAAGIAQNRVIADAKAKYVGGRSSGELSTFDAQVGSQPLPVSDVPLTSGGPMFFGRGMTEVLGTLGFNREGWVRARTSAMARLGEHAWSMRDQLSLVASDWHMPDGADAVARANRAGRHRDQTAGSHGLHKQLQRMVSMGVELPSFDLSQWVPVPPTQGVYVVSKNYKPAEPGDEPCPNIPKYPDAARHGLNSLWQNPGLDADSVRCYDTAPFRDTHAYRDSLSIQMFLARGPHFMGCSKAQADDPTIDCFEGASP